MAQAIYAFVTNRSYLELMLSEILPLRRQIPDGMVDLFPDNYGCLYREGRSPYWSMHTFQGGQGPFFMSVSDSDPALMSWVELVKKLPDSIIVIPISALDRIRTACDRAGIDLQFQLYDEELQASRSH